MNALLITCLAVLFMQHFVSASDCSCKCNNDTPLEFLYQIIKHFKEVHTCGRTFITKYGVTKDGVREISYQTELKENESPFDVCNCVREFLSQKDLLNGAIHSCCIRKNIVTMTVEGEPDPTFDPETENPENQLEQLKEIFNQFPKAEFRNHQCRTKARIDKGGNPKFKIQCDLRPDSPCKDELCEGILQYINQDKWLGELTSKCKSNGNVLDMEVMSK